MPLRLRGVGRAGGRRARRRPRRRVGLRAGRAERATTSPLADRAAAGHELGVAARRHARRAAARRPGDRLRVRAQRAPSPGDARGRPASPCSSALALVPLALVGALALSDRGLGGSISKGWNDLTDPQRGTPANAPDRLTAVGSVRARYWNEALKIFRGAQGGRRRRRRLRDRAPALPQRHARRAPRPRLRRADARRPRARRPRRLARAARRVAAPRAGRALGLWGAGRRRAVDARARRAGDAGRRRASSSACTRSSTGRGSSPAPRCSRCCAPAGWPAAGRPTSRRAPRAAALAARARGGSRWRAPCAVAAALVAAWTTLAAAALGRRGQRRARRSPRRGGSPRRRAAGRPTPSDLNPLSVDPLFERAAIEQRPAGPTPRGPRSRTPCACSPPTRRRGWRSRSSSSPRADAPARASTRSAPRSTSTRARRAAQPTYLQASPR